MYKIEDVSKVESTINELEREVKGDFKHLKKLAGYLLEDVNECPIDSPEKLDRVEIGVKQILRLVQDIKEEQRILKRFENCAVKVEE